MDNIAILGSGMAAATLFARLSEVGLSGAVELFDKSRGIGGRMATRYTDTRQFDHGASFFTARTPSFQAFLADLTKAGTVAAWEPDVTTLSPGGRPYKRPWFEPHYVAMPRMNGLCKYLLADATTHTGTEIRKVERRGNRNWLVSTDEQRFGPFDWVISTAPAPQTIRIFASAASPDFDSVTFDPCIALMASINPSPTFDAAVVKDSPIEWIAMTDSKPGRQCQPSLVAHASPGWSLEHLETDPASLVPALIEAIAALPGIDAAAIMDATAHRWRFARPGTPLGQSFWADSDQRLAACGDWCLGRTVEDAYTSANELARFLRARFNREGDPS